MYNTNIYDGSDKKEILTDCLKSIRKYANGILTFEDAVKTIYIDTVAGTVATYVDGKINYYIRGSKSSKNNGYVYAVIEYHHVDGTIHADPIGQHVIIAIASDFAGYSKERASRPEVCHVNGLPWDNRASNLEWGSHSENARQGKIVRSLEHYFPGRDTYTVIKNGEFVCVSQGLYNSWIQEYIDELGKNVFRLKKNTDYIDRNILVSFVCWLFNKGYWR